MPGGQARGWQNLMPSAASRMGSTGPAWPSLLTGTPGLPLSDMLGPRVATHPPFRAHLFFHARRAGWRCPGEEGGEVGVQCGLWLRAERQHLQARVELPQLLLQAEGRLHWGCRQWPVCPLRGAPQGTAHTGEYWRVSAYLGGSELLGMKAKSRRGKKSLGPIMPKPLVRFGCILCGTNTPRELGQTCQGPHTALAGWGNNHPQPGIGGFLPVEHTKCQWFPTTIISLHCY